MQAAVQQVAAISGQILTYLKDLVRIPTVNRQGTIIQSFALTPWSACARWIVR